MYAKVIQSGNNTEVFIYEKTPKNYGKTMPLRKKGRIKLPFVPFAERQTAHTVIEGVFDMFEQITGEDGPQRLSVLFSRTLQDQNPLPLLLSLLLRESVFKTLGKPLPLLHDDYVDFLVGLHLSLSQNSLRKETPIFMS